MNAEQLLAHYNRIADAPEAIPRLRRFILDLAVRGKLVPQDPNDEPASELLDRIAAEKARLSPQQQQFREPPNGELMVVNPRYHVGMCGERVAQRTATDCGKQSHKPWKRPHPCCYPSASTFAFRRQPTPDPMLPAPSERP